MEHMEAIEVFNDLDLFTQKVNDTLKCGYKLINVTALLYADEQIIYTAFLITSITNI